MKAIKLAVALALIGSANLALADTFNNGGFENGDLSGWSQGGGNWYYGPGAGGNAPLNPAVYAGGPSLNTVMTGGSDPITGANTVYNGKYSVRVNDSMWGANVSTISQTVANYTDNNIYFAWNAVLEDSHGLFDSGHFALTLHDDTTGTDVVTRGYSSAGAIGGGTSGVTWNTFGNWYSSGWVVENIDVAALGLLGHTFTLSLLASDCYWTGHGGYVYLDGFGAYVPPPTGVPVPAAMWLFGTAAAGFLGFRRKSKLA